MALRAHRIHPAHKPNFADENLETLIAKTDSSLSATNIHRRVRDLCNILSLAEEAAPELPADPNEATLAQVLQELQRKNDWRQCEFNTTCEL